MTSAALKKIAADLWVAEEPLSYAGFEMGRRMAVIRLIDGELLLHSPAALSDALGAELERLGDVRFVVPASNLHGHLHMEQYQAAYPDALLFSTPGLASKRTDLSFSGELTGTSHPAWRADLDQTTFDGHARLAEIEFFHRRTRTLITGDLCFNIGPHWPLETRQLAWGSGMKQRLGPTTMFRRGITDSDAARASLQRILAWDFDRILPGHGEIVQENAKQTLIDDLAWLLG